MREPISLVTQGMWSIGGENICPNANAPRPAAAQEYRAKEEEKDQIDYGMIWVMQDIHEIFGEPIFITDWFHYYSIPMKEKHFYCKM